MYNGKIMHKDMSERRGKVGPGRRHFRRQLVLKKKNQKNVLPSRWCQYTEAGAGRRRDCHWARLTLGWPSSRRRAGLELGVAIVVVVT